ncbi:MAG TPA: hypothetical protein VND62_10735 [Acidimicrobiales bacterium]|nr:hypothetical protein [Acidimicrobiales bacterium]
MRVVARLVALLSVVAGLSLAAIPVASAHGASQATGAQPFEIWCC